MVADAEYARHAEPKARIFISYSRRDMAFADRLEAALKARGFEPLIDRAEIFAFEDWWKRITALIGRADTVVFVLSPDSVASDVALKEVIQAASFNKRFAPIVYRRTNDKALPEVLRRLNFIFFDDPSRFEASADQLAEALRTDIDWIRQHTEHSEAARRWETAGRPSGLLLRSPALDEAEHWIGSRPPGAPPPTDETLAFIGASRRDANRRRLRARANMLAIIAVAIIAALAWRYQEVLAQQIYWYSQVRGHVLATAQETALRPKAEFKECTDCPIMIVVSGGTFMMGSLTSEKDRNKDEGPQHEVTIARSFAVSKFEVTFDQWEACIQYGGCTRAGSPFGGGKQPTINITWDDAKGYVNWLLRLTGQPYRLLTEAEWEYAARAGSVGSYSFEGDTSLLDEYAWYRGNSGSRSHPVGEKKPNVFGLYDMHGNVSEWVEDCYHENYSGEPPTDGSAWTTGDCGRRMMRGGPWNGDPRYLRSANRNWSTSDLRRTDLGFRVGRTLLPP